jgi:hypothetical protein
LAGLGRGFYELIEEADGSPLNEWAEVEARVEKRMEDWPEWPNPSRAWGSSSRELG